MGVVGISAWPTHVVALMDPAATMVSESGEKRGTDYSFHMAITGWSEQIFNDMPKVVA